MRKFECKQCEPAIPCVIEWGGSTAPMRCPFDGIKVEWSEVNHLPKLTVEALAERGIEWPEWATCAAVDSDGSARFFKGRVVPFFADDVDPLWVHAEADYGDVLIPGKWDASDWKNSLIERTAVVKQNLTTEPPEWCKAGEWCVYAPSGHFYKIKSIDIVRRRIRITDPTKENSDLEPTFESFSVAYRPARVRPWNDETIPAVPFGVRRKILTWDKSTVMCSHCSGVHIYGREYAVGYQTLMDEYELSNGDPCGVLEVVA